MGDGVKLPVIETVKLSVRWTLAILVKHWLLVLLIVLVPVLVAIPLRLVILPDASLQPLTPASAHVTRDALLGGALQIFIILLSIILALVSHNEVLKGSGGFNAQTLGPSGGRFFGYALDTFIIAFIFIVPIIIASGLLIFFRYAASNIAYYIMFIVFIIVLLFSLVSFTRLSLRFPSRAVGELLPWGAVWRLGRGNTLRLIGGEILVSILILVPAVPVLALSFWFQADSVSVRPPAFLAALALSLLSSLLVVVQVVFVCAFLSLAYAYLRDARPKPVRAEPRF